MNQPASKSCHFGASFVCQQNDADFIVLREPDVAGVGVNSAVFIDEGQTLGFDGLPGQAERKIRSDFKVGLVGYLHGIDQVFGSGKAHIS